MSLAPGRHIPQLDGLRGLAILLVLLHHCWICTHIPWIGRIGGRAGWVGVDLFFVLSGFLITGILLDARGSTAYFQSFYARRVLRIFPVYYVTLAALAVASAHLPMGEYLWTRAPAFRLASLLYAANWVPNESGGAHFWSLAVEEQFYLFWPWCVRKLSPVGLRRLCLTMLVLAPALRIGLTLEHASGWQVYTNTFCRMDALAMGALCALGVRGYQSIPDGRWLVATVIGSVGMLISAGGYYRESLFLLTIGLSVVPLGAAALLLLVLEHPGFLCWSLLRKLGTISYGVYLLHLPVLGFFLAIAGNELIELGLGIVVTLALAALSFEYFEQPILRWKVHFPAALQPAEPR